MGDMKCTGTMSGNDISEYREQCLRDKRRFEFQYSAAQYRLVLCMHIIPTVIDGITCDFFFSNLYWNGNFKKGISVNYSVRVTNRVSTSECSEISLRGVMGFTLIGTRLNTEYAGEAVAIVPVILLDRNTF